MAKSNGIKSLKQAAKLLNKHAPDGESLAYINPEEARILKARGGSGIMTLQGVPSYIDWGALAENILPYGKQILDVFNIGSPVEAATPPYFPNYGSPGQRNPYQQPIGELPFLTQDMGGSSGGGGGESGNFLKDLATGAWTGIKERYSDPKNIATDLGSLYIAKEAYEGKEDLNDWERKKYEDILADIAKGEAKYASDVGASPLEITNMPSRTELAEFTETTGRPDMITTPVAQGGRIGYNLGGIDTPFQGIGALNPRMGYANAGEVYENPYFGKKRFDPLDVGAQTWDVTQDYASNQNVPADASEEFNESLLESMSPNTGGGGGVLELALEDAWKTYIKEGGTLSKEAFADEWMKAMTKKAHGGRIGAQKGGIMPLLNLGGMEKDYRQEGGFVPIGRKEKADDVPARLSKNEFVFTADAVRAAGGGDIDEGAQRMYNVMKNLEAGGEISQQSQGKA